MKPNTQRRLERLEKKQDPVVPLIWFRVVYEDGEKDPGQPPEGWEDAPEHLRQVICFRVIPSPKGQQDD